jgi:hypothetical protein
MKESWQTRGFVCGAESGHAPVFSEDEREVCVSCGQRACVAMREALASFCLGCGAIEVNGIRINANPRISL